MSKLQLPATEFAAALDLELSNKDLKVTTAYDSATSALGTVRMIAKQ